MAADRADDAGSDKAAAELGRFLEHARADPEGTLIALDLDGTISTIAPAPQAAFVDRATVSALRPLAERYRLWFVSGRDADEARRMIGLPAAGYIGAHGLEVLTSDGPRPIDPDLTLPADLAGLVDAVNAAVPDAAPYVERKRWSVAFHYRASGSSPDLAQRLAETIEAHLTPHLRLRLGKMVYEVGPAVDHDKGTALAWLIDTVPPQRVLVAGDDLTDVAMFAVLAERRSRGEIEGVSVAVLHAAETPAELVAACDTTVGGIDGLRRLLLALAPDTR